MKTRRMSYADAMADALRLCFKDDPHFTVIGNEIFGIGPQRVQFEPLQAEFPDRVYFPPTSEAAFTALAAGAAMCGHRTFAHLGVASFSYPAVSSIANEIATIRLSSGGRIRAPFIMHLNHGIVMGTSSQHSESPQCMYWIEVVDPRTLVPFDQDTILASVAKTGRLVVADETRLSCGVASEISAIVAERAFRSLKAPIVRVARPDAPVSAAPTHEAFVKPTPDKIVAAVRKVLA
jgi:pyruvate/2-oxoglutarate/acetoin dehydrogenase E1 component